MQIEIKKTGISLQVIIKKDDGSEVIVDEMSLASTGKAFTTLDIGKKVIQFVKDNQENINDGFGGRLPFTIEFIHPPKKPIKVSIMGVNSFIETFTPMSLTRATVCIDAIKKTMAALGLTYNVADIDWEQISEESENEPE